MDNLEEMDKFLERYSLPRLNQKKYSLGRPVTSTEMETMIKNLPQNKSPVPDSFTGKYYQTFTEELTPVLLKQFQNNPSMNWKKKNFQSHFMRPLYP